MSYSRNLARIARKGVITVNTAQELRDLTIYGGNYPETVETLGALTAGDGGYGLWRWDAANIEADNLGTVLLPTGHAGAGRWVRENENKPVDVRWFGAIPGAADVADEINQAALHARNNKLSIYFSCGQFNFSKQLDLQGVAPHGEGQGITILKCIQDLGADNSSILLGPPANNTFVYQKLLSFLTVEGSAVPPGTVGSFPTQGDGVEVLGRGQVLNIEIKYFYKGLVLASPVGHVYVEHFSISNCFYGIWYKINGYDYYFMNGSSDGNRMASVGVRGDRPAPINGQTLDGAACNFVNVQFGHGPYGIYQEAGNTSRFLTPPCRFDSCKFEQIGNGAIFTENAVNNVSSGSMRFNDVGFSWGTANYNIAGKPKDYAIVLGLHVQGIEMKHTVDPFINGTLGAWFINALQGQFVIELNTGSLANWNTQKIVVNSGGQHVRPLLRPVLGGTFPANQTSYEVATNYYGPAAGFVVNLMPQIGPGLGAYWISAANDPATGEVKFTVHVPAPGPTSNVSFRWGTMV